MLLGTLGANWLGNLLTDKDTIRASKDPIKADAGTIRAGQVFSSPSSFTKFWNTKVLPKWT